MLRNVEGVSAAAEDRNVISAQRDGLDFLSTHTVAPRLIHRTVDN